MSKPETTRIAVALSGGVDSSTAAALLVEEGRPVIGFTLKVWDGSRCCSLEDVEDARRVARHLDIPFYVLDAHQEFEARVVGPFVAAYGQGRTPNPCIWCNRRIKFGWLLARARALGCEALATGHYARVDGPPGARVLRRGVDRTKDQSYFLVPEAAEDLDRVRFPLGGLTKEEVREQAAREDLPVARKSESQDVCFVPDGDLARFLETRLVPRPGDIVDAAGRVLGRHRGVHAYTVGQRRGLGVSAGRPLHVVRREAASARLVLGPREDLLSRGLRATGAVWLEDPPARPFRCAVQLRSTAPEVRCRVAATYADVEVEFDEPQFGVAPGQMAVFYRGDRVLGGAWIEAAVPRGQDVAGPTLGA